MMDVLTNLAHCAAGAPLSTSFVWIVGHSEDGELSLMGRLFKAQRMFRIQANGYANVSLVGGAFCLRVLRFYFVRFCGCISPEKLFQMRIIEYDDGPVAFQREVMGSRI